VIPDWIDTILEGLQTLLFSFLPAGHFLTRSQTVYRFNRFIGYAKKGRVRPNQWMGWTDISQRVYIGRVGWLVGVHGVDSLVGGLFTSTPKPLPASQSAVVLHVGSREYGEGIHLGGGIGYRDVCVSDRAAHPWWTSVSSAFPPRRPAEPKKENCPDREDVLNIEKECHLSGSRPRDVWIKCARFAASYFVFDTRELASMVC
jgi:hypothetical protein